MIKPQDYKSRSDRLMAVQSILDYMRHETPADNEAAHHLETAISSMHFYEAQLKSDLLKAVRGVSK